MRINRKQHTRVDIVVKGQRTQCDEASRHVIDGLNTIKDIWTQFSCEGTGRVGCTRAYVVLSGTPSSLVRASKFFVEKVAIWNANHRRRRERLQQHSYNDWLLEFEGERLILRWDPHDQWKLMKSIDELRGLLGADTTVYPTAPAGTSENQPTI